MSKQSLREKQRIARWQGLAYQAGLELMKTGGDVYETKTGNGYVVSVIGQRVSGMYLPKINGQLEWSLPKMGANVQVNVVVQDKIDNRFIPNLKIKCQLINRDQKIISKTQLPFLWHPYLFHYGRNMRIPIDGEYIIKIVITKPEFGRHDKKRGGVYKEDITLEFGPLWLKIRKESSLLISTNSPPHRHNIL